MFGMMHKRVLITGGDGFLGGYIRALFLSHGATIISTDIHGSKDSMALDISDAKAVAGFGQRCRDFYGPFDVIINNAAASFKGKNISDEQFRKTLDVNVRGTYNCIKELEKFMVEDGCIVNIASIYGIHVPDFKIYEGNEELYSSSAYGASKAAIIQMTKYYAALLAPKRVNVVSPGGIFQGHSDDFSTKYSERVPLKRMAEPKEVANAILFLSSPLSSYITGHNLVVDGGVSVC